MWSRRAWLGLGRVIATLVLASSATASDIISFDAPGVTSVQQGQLLNVTVGFDFADLTLGGGFDLDFSASLFAFKKFDFDLNLGDDPAFRSKPADNQSSGPFTIAFGNFSGLTGVKTVGILQLLSMQDLILGAGPVLVSGRDNTLPTGPFVDGSGGTLPVQYAGLRGSAVPEPGTALFVGMGLAAIAAARREGLGTS